MCPRRANPELRKRRREDLIRAGYAEILDKGLHATTLDSVVERARSSKGGALYYFPTKDDLLYSVLEWLFSQLSATLDEVVQGQVSPRARLASELEVLFHSAEVNRKLYQVLFDYLGISTRSSRFRPLFAAFFERCYQRDIAIIGDGVKQRQFRQVDPAAAATAIRALVDGYCLQWLMGEDSVPLEVYRDRCRAVLAAYLLR
jgi:AcrR family transcriptional regulator